ncbi:hypothetical protein [Halorubrum amylolyticum]|uniref:hypothetical protein n=1 Tax=Halorubrum amylolyticum TaxID=2508724 RepID=UPI001008D78D|nr:hypothetical protein [Halorubrum amylolyticum]
MTRRFALCVVLSLVLMTAGVGIGTTAAQETAINMTVNGDSLTDSGEFVVLEDPTTNVRVSSDTAINLIEIRINGEIRHSYRPNSTSLNQTVPLELDPNENTVEVIARADSVATFKTTLTKNTASPRIRYTSPFSTSVKGGPANETNISSGQVTLAGDLHTVSEVERIQIERTLTREVDNQSIQDDREIHQITDPGNSFSQDLLLGNGTNEIVARYTDSNGRTNKDSFRLIVNDATDPEVNLDVPNKSYTDSVRIRGTVRDETKIHKIEINRTTNNGSQVLLMGSNSDPDPNRLTYELDTTVDLYYNNSNNEFRLVAEDAAGNIQNRTFTVEYDPEPRVAITENTTNARTEMVRVAGNISEARIDRVTLETIDTTSGERVDLVRVYEAGTPTESVEFDQKLKALPDTTVVRLLIGYENGQHTQTIPTNIRKPQNETVEGVGTGDDEAVPDDSEFSNETESINRTSNPARTIESENNSTTTGDEEPTDNWSAVSPALLPIRTRDALGGVVIVGGTYLLGHWV